MRQNEIILGDCREKCEGSTPTCSDFDEDCDEVRDKVICYLYDPQRGMCPYLRADDETSAA